MDVPSAFPSTILPCTVAGLQAPASNAEYVLLIGVVEREKLGHVFLDFTLNDSSGRLPVRCILEQPYHRNILPELEGKYVRVIGRVINDSPRHILTEYLSLVEGADEVSYHLIAAAHSHLSHGVGRPSTSGSRSQHDERDRNGRR